MLKRKTEREEKERKEKDEVSDDSPLKRKKRVDRMWKS